MTEERILEIVLRARDEATKTLKSIGGTAEGVGTAIKDNINKAGIAAGVLAAGLSVVAKEFIDVGATMQQNKVAFDTFLGNSEKAGQLLKQLSDFAAKTPFELPQVVEGSKRLLAYGIEAQKIIPTFKTLGDIAAGVGTDKLPNLILAFGQVKAATKLTGMELRQFSEAGVPLLQALVDQANKSGGALVTMGGSAKKTKVDVAELNDKLAIARQRLKEAETNAKTKQSTLMSLRNTVQNYEQDISKAGNTQGVFSKRVKVTTEQMKEMIEKGQVSFEQVQEALEGMTQQGGKFYNLMDKQSKTFSGVMSNVRDEFTRFALNVLGFTAEGEIRQGSIFYYLQIGVEKLLTGIQVIRPYVQQFVDSILANKTALVAIAGAIGGLVVLAAAAFIATFGTAILVMAGFAAAGALIAVGVMKLIEVFNAWKPVIEETWNSFMTFITNIPTSVSMMVNSVVTWFESLPTRVNQFLIDLFFQKIPFAIGFAAGYLAVKIPEIINNVINWFSTLPKRTGQSFEDTKQAIFIKILEAGAWLQETLSQWGTSIQQFISDIPQKVSDVFNQAKEWAIQKVKEMYDSVMGWLKGIQDFFGKIIDLGNKAADATKKGIDAGIKAGVKQYSAGGYVPATGYAYLHAGEYVLSRDMLAGRQAIAAPVSNYSYSSPINISVGSIRDSSDINSLTQQLAFILKTSGRL